MNGDANEQERQDAFERLAMNESEANVHKQPLDYIFSVEILNDIGISRWYMEVRRPGSIKRDYGRIDTEIKVGT
ncbi:MAG: hypothetical protein ACLRMX_01390 [Lachnospira eligens]